MLGFFHQHGIRGGIDSFHFIEDHTLVAPAAFLIHARFKFAWNPVGLEGLCIALGQTVGNDFPIVDRDEISDQLILVYQQPQGRGLHPPHTQRPDKMSTETKCNMAR